MGILKIFCCSFTGLLITALFATAIAGAQTSQSALPATGCLIQFEANFEIPSPGAEPATWMGRFFSPVYHLAAPDCPSAQDSSFHNYKFYGAGNYPQRKRVYAEQDRRDASGRWRRYGRAFYNWLQTKRAPAGTKFRQTVDVRAATVTPDNIHNLTINVGDTDLHIYPTLQEKISPTCLKYLPKNIKPLKVYGESQCLNWIK